MHIWFLCTFVFTIVTYNIQYVRTYVCIKPATSVHSYINQHSLIKQSLTALLEYLSVLNTQSQKLLTSVALSMYQTGLLYVVQFLTGEILMDEVLS